VTESTGITVAGRVFRPVTSRSDGKVNFDQYNYLITHIWAAAADAPTLPEILARVAASGHARSILAGLVQEEVNGEALPWTAEGATKIAKFFGQPHSFADCAAMQMALLEVLPSFFPGALASQSNSPGASEPPTPTTSEDTASASPTDSANSDPSSERLPVTT
jgi:hypothetical protein